MMPLKDELPDSLKELAFRNGTPIRAKPAFDSDVDRLIRGIEKHLENKYKAKDEVRKNAREEAKPTIRKEAGIGASEAFAKEATERTQQQVGEVKRRNREEEIEHADIKRKKRESQESARIQRGDLTEKQSESSRASGLKRRALWISVIAIIGLVVAVVLWNVQQQQEKQEWEAYKEQTPTWDMSKEELEKLKNEAASPAM